jgi:hypothetical protein
MSLVLRQLLLVYEALGDLLVYAALSYLRKSSSVLRQLLMVYEALSKLPVYAALDYLRKSSSR